MGTAEECALTGVHDTLQVTHDKKYSAKEQRNSFHCFSDKLSKNQCFCTCSQHPPCTSVEGKTLNNVAIRGNTWSFVSKQQHCCNMCTNHPACGSYTFDGAANTCTLYEGSPDYADAAAPSTTWSGCQSGDIC